MGTFKVRVEIADSSGEQWEVVEALVDTGATYTMLPSPLLRRLGIQAHARDVFMLADGRNVELEIGRGWIRVSGRSEVTLVVFGEPLAEPLLGAYALEGLRLAADPVGRRLVPVPALLMAQTSLSAARLAAPGTSARASAFWPLRSEGRAPARGATR